MSQEALSFFLYTWIAIAVQGLFALFEMACVSFNRIRLQYYVALGKKRALWLYFLLSRPSRLFGTTLIGITAALQIGSECSRCFYESIGLDPDWAPLTQIAIAVVFGELAPLFAARRHPEQIAMFFAPLMICIARILSPLIWAFDSLSRSVHRLMGMAKEIPLFLSREEVRVAFEEKKEDEFNTAIGKIFQLKTLTAAQLMAPLAKVHSAASTAHLADIRSLLSVHYSPFLPLYHRVPSNIVAIAEVRDLLRAEENQRAIDYAHSPWFVAKDTSILQILDQFRRNNQSMAVILDSLGQAIGVLTLDQIIDEIFGRQSQSSAPIGAPVLHIERTLSGDLSVSEFNRLFQAALPHKEGETLSDLIAKTLEHPPVKGEALRIGLFTFTVVEPTMAGAKTLTVQSLQD